jgi:hypothetical protein
LVVPSSRWDATSGSLTTTRITTIVTITIVITILTIILLALSPEKF